MAPVSWDSTADLNGEQLSAEDVPDHFDEIRDEADYTVPRGVADEMTELFGTITREYECPSLNKR
jgi:hypothetical protein